jgi:hypothetical protein
MDITRAYLHIGRNCDQGVEGVGNLITRLVNFHNDWSSGTSDSSVTLHCPFLQSFILRVTDFWMRLTSAFKAGSLETFHCLLNLFFRGTLSVMRAGMGCLGSFLERVCFRRHPKEHLLLFVSHGTSVHTHTHCQKRAAEITAGRF